MASSDSARGAPTGLKGSERFRVSLVCLCHGTKIRNTAVKYGPLMACLSISHHSSHCLLTAPGRGSRRPTRGRPDRLTHMIATTLQQHMRGNRGFSHSARSRARELCYVRQLCHCTASLRVEFYLCAITLLLGRTGRLRQVGTERFDYSHHASPSLARRHRYRRNLQATCMQVSILAGRRTG